MGVEARDCRLFCNTADVHFGPEFNSNEEVEEFIDWHWRTYEQEVRQVDDIALKHRGEAFVRLVAAARKKEAGTMDISVVADGVPVQPKNWIQFRVKWPDGRITTLAFVRCPTCKELVWETGDHVDLCKIEDLFE